MLVSLSTSAEMRFSVALKALGLLAVTAHAAPSRRWNRNYTTFHVYTEMQCPIAANEGEITAREGDNAPDGCWSLSDPLYHNLPAVEAIYFGGMTAKGCGGRSKWPAYETICADCIGSNSDSLHHGRLQWIWHSSNNRLR